MKNYNMILTEKQQNYQHYHYVKLINMNILQMKKILPSDQSRMIEQAKFTYSPLRKAFEEQTKKLLINEKDKQKLRWCRAQDLIGSKIPVTIEGFELQVS